MREAIMLQKQMDSLEGKEQDEVLDELWGEDNLTPAQIADHEQMVADKIEGDMWCDVLIDTANEDLTEDQIRDFLAYQKRTGKKVPPPPAPKEKQDILEAAEKERIAVLQLLKVKKKASASDEEIKSVQRVLFNSDGALTSTLLKWLGHKL
tara:strand:- start:3788 stop:4240 length:453 start_codon:yes stop_codon:yes gene_type:complete